MYGAYNEPFDQAKVAERFNEEFLQCATRPYELDKWNKNQSLQQMNDEEAQYLGEFAVYNLDIREDGKVDKWKNEQYEIVFGPLAKWIIEDGRARGTQRAQEEVHDVCDSQEAEEAIESLFDSGDAASIEEIMLLIGAFEHLTTKIQNLDGGRKYGRRQVPIETVAKARMSR